MAMCLDMAPEEWEGIFMANLLKLEIIAGYTRPVISLKELAL